VGEPVVIMEVTRGGKDPDEYYHVISSKTADHLDTNDPLKDLDEEDIIQGYLDTEEEARQWCAENGYDAEPDTFEAVGY
jgi:hypothetical protein